MPVDWSVGSFFASDRANRAREMNGAGERPAKNSALRTVCDFRYFISTATHSFTPRSLTLGNLYASSRTFLFFPTIQENLSLSDLFHNRFTGSVIGPQCSLADPIHLVNYSVPCFSSRVRHFFDSSPDLFASLAQRRRLSHSEILFNNFFSVHNS